MTIIRSIKSILIILLFARTNLSGKSNLIDDGNSGQGSSFSGGLISPKKNSSSQYPDSIRIENSDSSVDILNPGLKEDSETLALTFRNQHKPTSLLDSSTKKTNSGNGFSEYFTADIFIALNMFGLLTASGLYVTLFGFRIFRLLMVILGFYVSYYLILFTLTELNLYKYSNVGHQLGLFFGSVILGFIIAIACYMLEKINFVVFGTALGTVVTLFYAQFFINFSNFDDKKLFAIIYLSTSVLFSAAAFLFLDQTIIVGSALVGAIVTVINFGVLYDDFKSFEQRETLPSDSWPDFKNHLTGAAILFTIGVCSQYFIRKRIINKFNEKNLEEIQEASFVN